MAPNEPPRIRWFSCWDLLPLALALVLAAALPLMLQGLPDPLPTHFDTAGRPNGWTAHRAIPFMVIGIPALVWGALSILGYAFAGTEQDPDGRKCAAMAPLRALLSAGMQILLLSVLAIPRFGLGVVWPFLAVFFSMTVLGIVLMIRDMKRLGADGGNQAHYRWGLFYVNPEDPAIWVPKRLGLGWTLNFAHPKSWWLLALLMLVPIGVLVLVLLQAF